MCYINQIMQLVNKVELVNREMWMKTEIIESDAHSRYRLVYTDRRLRQPMLLFQLTLAWVPHYTS